MKVAGAILKQVKNTNRQVMKKRRCSASMAKSSDCIEGIQYGVHADEEVHNLSRRNSSRKSDKMVTISRSSTLPGRYKTS